MSKTEYKFWEEVNYKIFGDWFQKVWRYMKGWTKRVQSWAYANVIVQNGICCCHFKYTN